MSEGRALGMFADKPQRVLCRRMSDAELLQHMLGGTELPLGLLSWVRGLVAAPTDSREFPLASSLSPEPGAHGKQQVLLRATLIVEVRDSEQ